MGKSSVPNAGINPETDHPISEAGVAREVDAAVRALEKPNTPNVRAIRRRYSRRLKSVSAGYVLDLASVLREKYGHRWLAYELIANHRSAFATLDAAKLEALGQGIDSWWSVDSFARILSGPAWLHGQIGDSVIEKWHSQTTSGGAEPLW